MSTIGMKIGGTAAIMSMQTGAALLPFGLERLFRCGWREQFMSLSNVFSGGLMTGTALMHLLAEGLEELEPSLALGLTGVSFLLAWFLFGIFLPKLALRSAPVEAHKEKSSDLSVTDSEKDDENAPIKASNHHHHTVPEILSVIFAFALSFHSLFSGVVLGLQNSFSTALAIFLSLLAHKWSEAFAMGSTMVRDDAAFSWRRVLVLVLCPPIATMLGVGSWGFFLVFVFLVFTLEQLEL
jgi:zinc transporter 1/2/3